jgi:multidrug transporter EmrE-like cation transporter
MQKTIFYIFLYAACNVCGSAIIKLQLKQVKLTMWQEWVTFMLNVPFIIASSFIVFSALALFKALSSSQFSFVIPIATGINFLLTVSVGYFLFQDKLSMSSYLGFLLIIAGVLILSVNNQAHA